MPLRIWMPSCEAGPVNTAAWPSSSLSANTPGCCCADAGATAAAAAVAPARARAATTSFLCMGSSSSGTHCQKIRVSHELRHVELFPGPAVRILELPAQPGGRFAVGGALLELIGIA